MGMDSRTKLLQVRLTPEEQETFRRLAGEYRLDVSEFIRKIVEYVDVERPSLLRPLDASALEIAAA